MFNYMSEFPIPCWTCGGQLLASNDVDRAGLVCTKCSLIMTFRENLPELLEKLKKDGKI